MTKLQIAPILGNQETVGRKRLRFIIRTLLSKTRKRPFDMSINSGTSSKYSTNSRYREGLETLKLDKIKPGTVGKIYVSLSEKRPKKNPMCGVFQIFTVAKPIIPASGSTFGYFQTFFNINNKKQ